MKRITEHLNKNSAGGEAFAVDCWTRLDRFLILGCEGNTYYATERQLTQENAHAVEECIRVDGARTVKRIAEISESGRAPKNDYAVFALAMAAKKGDPATRSLALKVMPSVCRIGTHLFQFAHSLQTFGGWGRGTRRAMGDWYLKKQIDDLAYQLIKYQNREGWSHRDVLRLSHPKTSDAALNGLLRWVARGKSEENPDALPAIVEGFENAKSASTDELCTLIRKHNLPREALPTEKLNEPKVWEALLERMPMHAMVRNLATMTKIGLVAPMSNAANEIARRLSDPAKIKGSRLHPISILTALLTYKMGRGIKGSAVWSAVGTVVDALDGAFYFAFENVIPTNKRWCVAVDVSGSMGTGSVAGVPALTPRVVAAAMAQIIMATEKNSTAVAFTSGAPNEWRSSRVKESFWGGRYVPGISTLDISPKRRLDDVCNEMQRLPMGGTDCALPILWATANKHQFDAFVVLTDSETWAGNVSCSEALKEYGGAKLIVCGMVSNGFSVANPKDPNQMDVVGFDTAAPSIMSDFVR